MRPIPNKNVTQCALLGDHNVQFYASRREKHEVLFSNLRVGLDRGYSALYISSGETIERVRAEMAKFGLKPDSSANLNVADSRQFYMPDGEFQPDRIVGKFRGAVDESVDRGFEGLFVSSDVADVFDSLSGNLVPWFEYENSFGRTFRFPMEAICAYRADQLESNSQALLQLIQAHKNTITVRTISFMDNRRSYIDAVDQTLSDILGEETAKIILSYLEGFLKVPLGQIPDEIEGFNKALDSIFGGMATIIRRGILRNLYAKMELEYR